MSDIAEGAALLEQVSKLNKQEKAKVWKLVNKLVAKHGEEPVIQEEPDEEPPKSNARARRNRMRKRRAENNENRFLTMPEYDMFHELSEIDKRNWEGKQPTPRRPAIKLVKVTCDRCGRPETVSPSLTRYDADEQRTVYVCNKCSVRGRKG